MSLTYVFDADEEGWSLATDFAWDGTDGFPFDGCLSDDFTGVGSALTTSVSSLSESVLDTDEFSCWFKIAGTAVGGFPFVCTFQAILTIDGTPYSLDSMDTPDLPSSPIDTGWLEYSRTIPASGTLEQIAVIITKSSALSYPSLVGFFDSVYAGTPGGGPALPGTPELRFLGLDSDNTRLYVTCINGGTIQMRHYALDDFNLATAASFGTCAFTDPDSYSRALWPVTVGDSQVYVYGRDANNKQVQYNDLNGTLGWTDFGPGTATWATGKFCVALMPSPFIPDSIIAAFADDDIYMTVSGSTGWAKQGDAGTALRTAGRVTTEFNSILVAGQGTAQMYFSQNYGATFTNAYSGLAGTVNAVEVSR